MADPVRGHSWGGHQGFDRYDNALLSLSSKKGCCKHSDLLTVFSHAQWLSGGQTEASVYQQAEDGKTELSLMHFAITNPGWQPPRESTAFLGFLKEQVQRDGAAAGLAQGGLLPENALFTSIQSLQSESEVCIWGLGDDGQWGAGRRMAWGTGCKISSAFSVQAVWS